MAHHVTQTLQRAGEQGPEQPQVPGGRRVESELQAVAEAFRDDLGWTTAQFSHSNSSDLHPVSSLILGAIERRICTCQDTVGCRVVRTNIRYTNADR